MTNTTSIEKLIFAANKKHGKKVGNQNSQLMSISYILALLNITANRHKRKPGTCLHKSNNKIAFCPRLEQVDMASTCNTVTTCHVPRSSKGQYFQWIEAMRKNADKRPHCLGPRALSNCRIESCEKEW